MRTRRPRSIHRVPARLALGALLVVLAAVFPSAAGAGGHARSPQAGCAGGDTATRDVRRYQRALLCEHNVVRREHGLRRLRSNPELSRVAGRYAREMVSHHYFAHLSPGHRDHMDRIAAGSYRPATGCWTAGENLFFSRVRSTPAQLLGAWLSSESHSRNVLRPGWRDFGVGVVDASPQGDQGGLTVVALYGTRTSRACG
jgi:uncharacterized protein YkwD